MTEPALGFRWSSSLGVSVILFLVISFLYFMIGALTPVAYRRYGSELVAAFGLGFSRASDRAALRDVSCRSPLLMCRRTSTCPC